MLEALGAGAVARHAHRPALAAHLGHALAMTAVVAGQRPPRAVQDERHVAVRAAPGVAADAAVEEVRPATAVEQDDRLARVGQRVHRPRVQGAVGAAHVDDLDVRQRLPVDAPGETQPPQRPDALGPRRRAADEQHGVVVGRTLPGDAAGVVAGVALVLVGGVVLLVDHHEAEVGDRREDRRARADADLRLARAQPVPLVAALARRELGVQDRDGVPEAVDEARDDLRRQRDLGHEHDRTASLGERRRGGLQVDLGLARARDAVQQQAGRIASPRWPPRSRRGRQPGRRSGPAAPAAPRRPRARVRGARRGARAARGRGAPGVAARGGPDRRPAASRPTRAAPSGAP